VETKHVSVSGLIQWDQCPRAYHFSHDRKLRPNQRPASLASGSAVGHVIEHILKGEERPDDFRNLARQALQGEFKADATEKNVYKYLDGVCRALGRVPDWVWDEKAWHVEEALSYKFKHYGPDRENRRAGGDQLYEVHMRPDVFRFIDGDEIEGDEIEIVDFKTTDSLPLESQLWNPQLRYYAVALDQLHPNHLITIQYLTLPTGKSDKPQLSGWPLSPSVLETARKEMERRAVAIGEGGFDQPSYYKGICGKLPSASETPIFGCDFNKICAGIITGADYEPIIKEEYHEITRHD